jgi:hypothetical protein
MVSNGYTYTPNDNSLTCVSVNIICSTSLAIWDIPIKWKWACYVLSGFGGGCELPPLYILFFQALTIDHQCPDYALRE